MEKAIVYIHGDEPAIEIPRDAFLAEDRIEVELVKKLREELERKLGRHLCPPIPFKVEGSDAHGYVCPDCGAICNWG